MNVKKVLLIVVGCIGLVLGAIGAVVPLLPAFPFLMLSAYCFAKSSERLHTWFTGTALYRRNSRASSRARGWTGRRRSA